MNEKNICLNCKWCYADTTRCRRLVSTCIGMRDRLGSDFKKGNHCPYFEQGERQGKYQPLNFYNS